MLDNFPPAIKAAMGIAVDSFKSPLGYYTFAFTYSLLFGAIQAMNLGIGIVSKEEREKTADFILTKPVSRQDLSGVAYDSTGVRLTYIRPDTGSPTPLMTHTGTVEQSIAPETNQTTSAPPPVYEIPVETIATTRALIPGPITAFAVISGALLFAMKNVRK